MRLPRRLTMLSAFFLTLFLPSINASAEEFPAGVVGHWQYYNNAGWAAFRNGDYLKATQKFDAAIQVLKPYQKIDQRLLARSYADLAVVMFTQKRYGDAAPLAKWALQVRQADPKTKHTTLIQNVLLIAMIERKQHHDQEAELLFEQALALQTKALGSEHFQVALTIDDLATTLVDLGKYPEAETLYRRAIAIHEKVIPLQSTAFAEILEHYASLLHRVQRLADAKKTEARADSLRSSSKASPARMASNRLPEGLEGLK